jgi:tetratricopeptide (TPR) repeat protein/uncharacterized RDD family membrane protein YckC
VAETPSPALLGRRIRAGLLDAVLLTAICSGLVLVPLLTTGLVLPMWGVLAAGLGYSFIPLTAFRKTLGMKLFGVELAGRDGRPANPADLLFRELVGRGLLPGAFLFTILMSFVGSLLRVTRFAMPSGLGALMGLASLGTMAIIAPGHALPLFRADRRSLADILSRTCIVPPQPAPVPDDDEDDRQYQAGQRRKRMVMVVVAEVLLFGAALALPRLLTARTSSTEEYAGRITRQKLEKDFERTPDNEVVAQQLAEAYRKAGRPEDAEKTLDRYFDSAAVSVGCNARRALAFGDKLNGERRFEAAIQLVDRYEKSCEQWPRLLWVSVYAHQQRAEWKQVTEETTRLIDDEPEDSDFWWWRGEAYAKLGEYEQAAADYHQSMANQPNGFASGRYAAWVDKALQRPCEGAFALAQWMEAEPDDVEAWAGRERNRLHLAGDCDQLLGRGKAVFKPGSEAGPRTARLELGTQSGLCALEPVSGYTLLSAAFAKRAGLSAADGSSIQVRGSAGWTTAHLVTVPRAKLAGAQADNLLVAVVDQLPPSVDAIVGANLLWRFQTTNDSRGLTLQPRSRVR